MEKSKIRVMVVTPHPDDAEIGAGGTIASWIRQEREVIYVVCTNGDKGSSDLDMTSERLAKYFSATLMVVWRILLLFAVSWCD